MIEVPAFFFKADQSSLDEAILDVEKKAKVAVTFGRRKRKRSDAQPCKSSSSNLQACSAPSADGKRSCSEPLHKAPGTSSLNQTFLDFGQADFNCTRCRVCGMMFAKGQELDEKLHKSFHAAYLSGPILQGWTAEDVVQELDNKRRILCFTEASSQLQRRKVEEISCFVEQQLGLERGWLLQKSCKVYLMLSGAKNVSGFLATERIQTAYSVHSQGCENPIKFGQVPSTACTDDAKSMMTHHTCASAMQLPIQFQGAADQTNHGGGVQNGDKGHSVLSCQTTVAHSGHLKTESLLAQQSVNSNCLSQLSRTARSQSTADGKVTKHRSSKGGTKSTGLTKWLALGNSKAARLSEKVIESSAKGKPEQMQKLEIAAREPASQQSTEVLSVNQPNLASMAKDGLRCHPQGDVDGCAHDSDGADVGASNGQEPPMGESHEVQGNVTSQETRPAPVKHGPEDDHLTQDYAQLSQKDALRHNIESQQSLGLFKRDAMDSSKQACSGATAGMLVDLRHPVPAELGVRAIWVSASTRRLGVASALLDAARTSVASNVAVRIPKDRIAFTQPTDDGLAFAFRYTGHATCLTYMDDATI